MRSTSRLHTSLLGCLTFGLALSVSAPAHACIWDRDTLAMEKRAFPKALPLMTGHFLRHSPALYEWRVKDRTQRLKTASDKERPALRDDLAAALDKLGRHDEAVAVMKRSHRETRGRYETIANLGTFMIHGGNLTGGLRRIRQAIRINPKAHFGRERYQGWLVEYVLKRRGGQGDSKTLRLPLATGRGRNPTMIRPGFETFLAEKLDREKGLSRRDRKAAIKGVLGMMRFGNYRSPVLLEALGDLLMASQDRGGWRKQAKAQHRHLAARAYLLAAEAAAKTHKNAKSKYRELARKALHIAMGKGDQRYRDVTPIERELRARQVGATAFYEEIEANEKRWIAMGLDPDRQFDRKYFKKKVRKGRQPTLDAIAKRCQRSTRKAPPKKGPSTLHEIEPGKKEPLSLADMAVRFGDYQVPPRLHHNSPGNAVFQLEMPGHPAVCRVVARFDGSEEGTADTAVQSVTVMADLRL